MKLFTLIVVTAFVSCSNSTSSGDNATILKDTFANAKIIYPYTASYTSQFEIGNPEHNKIVLEILKDAENNSLDAHASLFADSVEYFSADGNFWTVTRDSLIAMGKRERAKCSFVKNEVQAWIPLKSTDRKDEWVSIWVHQIFTKNNKTDSLDFQENWLIKNGKVARIVQYTRKLNPEK